MDRTVAYRRIYDEPEAEDGRRVLVDRVWPRGIRRDAGRFDEWLPEIAPSTDLRKWFGHDPARFDEFRRRFLDELDDPARANAKQRLRDLAHDGHLTLLTAARDLEHSQAAVLAEWLRHHARRR
ncbi:MAG TPA: DUF488 family protein [Micromonosporaceae bacterium]|jgi:uncharacterized protein YeaO (DUF488 family)